jgi:hypothetical protein
MIVGGVGIGKLAKCGWGVYGLGKVLGLSILLALSSRGFSQERNDEVQAFPAPQGLAPAEHVGAPVRLGWFSDMEGNVVWRPTAEIDWAAATLNTPIREGGQVWVADGSRSEITFDDGTVWLLGNGGVASLEKVYTDSEGEFSEIKLTEGSTYLEVPPNHDVIQVDTPRGMVTMTGPCIVRIDVDDDLEVAVRQGSAKFEGMAGTLDLAEGDYADVNTDAVLPTLKTLPAWDGFDNFADQRYQVNSVSDPHLPQNQQLIAGDLRQDGSWEEDPQYGSVWSPNVSSGWQPYSMGTWSWIDPFGWTWIAAERWGWAPFHYGAWFKRHHRWFWAPGPVHQYWSPGIVSFATVEGNVCWAPLAPWEIVYPQTLSVGTYGASWSKWYSIGAAGTYYPVSAKACAGVPWDANSANHFRGKDLPNGVHAPRFIENVAREPWSSFSFVPAAAQTGGATGASIDAFFQQRGYEKVPDNYGKYAFSKGQVVGVQSREHPVSGPVRVAKPSVYSWGAGSHFQPQGLSRVVSRPVYRGKRFAQAHEADETAQAAREVARAPAKRRAPARRESVPAGVRLKKQSRWRER